MRAHPCHSAVLIGKAQLCGFCHPRLQQADWCGHLQNHSQNARGTEEIAVRFGFGNIISFEEKSYFCDS